MPLIVRLALAAALGLPAFAWATTPADIRGKSLTSAGCNPCWGEMAQYTTFSSPQVTYEVRRYDGRDVVLLLPSWHPLISRMSPARVRTMVDRLDLLYATYRELLGWAPPRTSDPSGRHIVAVLAVNGRSALGVAIPGGDRSEYANSILEDATFEADDDVLSRVFISALATNFDPITHWDYGADPSKDWATFLQVWAARRMSRTDDSDVVRWNLSETLQTTDRWSAWRSDPSRFTWQRCVVNAPRPPDCRDHVDAMHGVLLASAARHVEPAIIRQWLRTVRVDTARPSTALERSDYALRTLADATRSDTRCIADHFRWPRGSTLDAAAQYATPFAGCVDGDRDGAPRFDDCDDASAAVRPGATDVPDGVDNDCDSVIDERVVREPAGGDFADNIRAATPIGALPFAAEGVLPTAADRDAIAFEGVIPTTRQDVRLCASGDALTLSVLTPENQEWGPDARVEAGACVTLGIARRHAAFRIDRVGAASGSASWRLDAGVSAEGWPRRRVVALATTGGNGARAVVDAARVPGGTAGVELRWTASGAGVLKAGAVGDADSLVAPPLPAASMGRRTGEMHQLRAQLFRDGLPIEEPSRPFTVATEGFALSTGVTVSSTLPAGATEDAWYIDVPTGIARLVVATTSPQNIDLHAARVAAPVPAREIPLVAAAPARALADARATTPSGNETLTIASPAAGRWYLTPTNSSAAAAGYTLRATLEGTAPSIRSGGYFNPGRPGHGLFVHPAGGEWAGLWYTYERDSGSTWYYLQGPAPAANGQWNGAIFRSRWDGKRAELQAVGNAVLTPGQEDGFTFSWNLEGQAGSEAFRSFGRGCPRLGGGAPVDASQHYFDPVRAGSGYSVQLMTAPAAYEFIAAFVYGEGGMPRFLVAERNGVGARDEALGVDLLFGFCPSCEHVPVTRSTRGTLRRTFTGSGELATIQLQTARVGPTVVHWNVTDAVRMLDERVRTQGCAL